MTEAIIEVADKHRRLFENFHFELEIQKLVLTQPKVKADQGTVL